MGVSKQNEGGASGGVQESWRGKLQVILKCNNFHKNIGKTFRYKKINKQTGRTYGEEGNFSSQHSLGGSFPSNTPPPLQPKNCYLFTHGYLGQHVYM